MKTSNIVVGLDIGTTKIVAIVGRRNEFGKVEILGMGKSESYGVARGVVQNIDKTVESIKTAVAEAKEQSGVDFKVVNVGIAGQHIKSVQHRGIKTRSSIEEEISQDDIDALIDDMYKLVMQPGEEIIHVLPQEYIIDSEQGIKNPIGMAGIRLEANFHIITGQVTAISNIMKCVRKAGLEVSELTLEPLASSEAVLSDEEKEAGVVLVDIGGGTTDVAIFQDGIIRHTAVIPFGGNVITEDIKENEIVSIPGLRGRPHKEISIKNLSAIIQARMEEIVEHVDFEIRNSGYKKKLIAGVVVTGGGSMLKHITQLVEYITGMDTRIGYPNEHLASGGSESITSPMYATAVGLLIKGLEKVEKENKKVVVVEDTSVPEMEEEEEEQEAPEPEQPNAIQGHSKEKSNGFFEKIKKFFDEDLEGGK